MVSTDEKTEKKKLANDYLYMNLLRRSLVSVKIF